MSLTGLCNHNLQGNVCLYGESIGLSKIKENRRKKSTKRIYAIQQCPMPIGTTNYISTISEDRVTTVDI